MSDRKITWGLIGCGAAVWFSLSFIWPLHMDNMAWHPSLVTAASVLLGFGLGRLLPEKR
jgi:hypothetical protein|tara:strand:+ start:193 stop:369 length:177 start_codon:yes stop_codon:yes gene_type:complete